MRHILHIALLLLLTVPALGQVRPPPRPPIREPAQTENRSLSERSARDATPERLLEGVVRGETLRPLPPSLQPQPGALPAPRPPVGEIPSIGPLDEQPLPSLPRPLLEKREGESLRNFSQRLSRFGLDRVCPSGGNCPRNNDRLDVKVFMRGAWASTSDAEMREGKPHTVYDATSTRCGAPGCKAVSEGAVGTDGSQRVEAYQKTTGPRVFESGTQVLPGTAAEAVRKARMARETGNR